LAEKLKLDLHVHVFEEFLPISPRLITVNSVRRLIEKIREAGLDGVAITEHANKEYGYRVKEIVESQFGGAVIIIPGMEVEDWSIHYVELDLDFNGQRTFRFLAHPGYPSDPARYFDSVSGKEPDFGCSPVMGMEPRADLRFSGIEIENGMHNWHIDKTQVKSLAEEHNLVLLSNSDAHYLRDVGKCYTEIAPEDFK